LKVSNSSGVFTVDEGLLRSQGVTDFDPYATTPGNKDLLPDFFLDDGYTFPLPTGSQQNKTASAKFTSSAATSETLAFPGFKASDVFQMLASGLMSMAPADRSAAIRQVNE
jgi:hypothetical protein